MKKFEGIWKVALSLVVCVTTMEASSGGASSCNVRKPPASCYGSGGPCSCSTPCLGPEVYASRPALFPKTCGGDFFLGAEVLYEKPSLEGFYLGSMVDRVVLPKTIFGPGVRVHVGFTLPEDGWYLKATGSALCPTIEDEDDESRVNVTSAFSSRYKADQKSSVPRGPQPGLDITDSKFDATDSSLKTNVPKGAFVPLGKSNSLDYGLVGWSWELRSYVGDLVMGRAAWLSKFLEFDLHLGVRAVSFEQTWNLRQEQFAAAQALQISDFSVVELYSKYRGLGQLVGVDTRWHLGCGFALYNKLALGSLYGTNSVREGEVWELSTEGKTKTTNKDDQKKQIFVLPTNTQRGMSSFLDIGVGLDWDMVTCGGQYAFRVSVGWEGKRFSEQNKFFAFTPFLYPVRTQVADGSGLKVTPPPNDTANKWSATATPAPGVGGVGVSGAAIDEMSGGLLLSGWTLGLDICF